MRLASMMLLSWWMESGFTLICATMSPVDLSPERAGRVAETSTSTIQRGITFSGGGEANSGAALPQLFGHCHCCGKRSLVVHYLRCGISSAHFCRQCTKVILGR